MPPIALEVDGKPVEVPDDGSTLLTVLRERLGLTSVKDGCSPQGQCGCCTVLVDGAPRVACVTPVRRVRGRSVTTLDGLDPGEREAWGQAFCATGASQCGFCTPGIVVRLAGLAARSGGTAGEAAVEQALLAHLCRCTGWRTILDAWSRHAEGGAAGEPDRDLEAAGRRATIEGGSPQRVAPAVALGHGGFADDGAPPDALVAVPDGAGGWAVAATLAEARDAAGKVQGRRTTAELRHPLDVPPGPWAATLRTTWVEPGYLELDAAWCEPGGEPATPLANGGAFGGKRTSVVTAAARELADRHGRPVRAVLAREDAVRLGPKRPPVAGGIRADGTRCPAGGGDAGRRGGGGGGRARPPGRAGRRRPRPADVPGPPGRGLGGGGRPAGGGRPGRRGEPVVPRHGARTAAGDGTAAAVTVRSPAGAVATAEVRLGPEAAVHVRIACGAPLDGVVLRSYCIGAAHMALGWVCSEGLAVDASGAVHDLTIRSFGILRAVDMPPVTVEIVPDGGPPVNGSDAVFAAVAAAAWRAQGCPPDWPTGRLPRGD